MTQEEKQKQLLLKALCAGLPYHLRIHICNDSWEGCRKGEFDNMMGFHHVEAFLCDRIEILPYLRPMSSMTDEERMKIAALSKFNGLTKSADFAECSSIVVDYCNSRYLDYRGLIPMGLALEAPKDMYKTE